MKNDSMKHCKDYGKKLKPHKSGSTDLYKIYEYCNKYCICTFLKKTWSFAYGMKVRKVADELSQSSGSRLSWNTEKNVTPFVGVCGSQFTLNWGGWKGVCVCFCIVYFYHLCSSGCSFLPWPSISYRWNYVLSKHKILDMLNFSP